MINDRGESIDWTSRADSLLSETITDLFLRFHSSISLSLVIVGFYLLSLSLCVYKELSLSLSIVIVIILLLYYYLSVNKRLIRLFIS